MRCPDCNKFVSYDEPEPELQDVSVNGTTIEANVRLALKCQECGTELKDNEFNTTHDFDHECKPEKEREKDWKPDEDYKKDDEPEAQFEIEDDGEPQGESRTETKDRHGKQIKLSRYMKTFYGYTLEVGLKCRCCGEPFSVEIRDEEQASGFNECC